MYTAQTLGPGSTSCWILIQNNKFIRRTKNIEPVSSKLQHGHTVHYNPLEQSGPSSSSSEEKRQVLRAITAGIPVAPWKQQVSL